MVDIAQSAPILQRRDHFDNERMAGSVPVWAKNAATENSKIFGETAYKQTEIAGDTVPPSLSFGELLDVINPLQHIPIVNGFYRDLTGDAISPVAKIAGGVLFGGVIGGAVSVVNAAMEEHSGKDMAGNLMTASSSNSYERADSAEELIITATDTNAINRQTWKFNT